MISTRCEKRRPGPIPQAAHNPPRRRSGRDRHPQRRQTWSSLATPPAIPWGGGPGPPPTPPAPPGRADLSVSTDNAFLIRVYGAQQDSGRGRPLQSAAAAADLHQHERIPNRPPVARSYNMRRTRMIRILSLGRVEKLDVAHAAGGAIRSDPGDVTTCTGPWTCRLTSRRHPQIL